MGAQQFRIVVKGKTAREAFDSAVRDAQYERGHGGYTGTIAEKHSFKMLDVPGDRAAKIAKADEMLDNDHPMVRDKWGPAVCIKLDEGEYAFFGWTSS